MPSQPSPDKKAVTYRLRRELLAAVQAEALSRGDTLTDIVVRAFKEYLTPPPADDQTPVATAARPRPAAGRPRFQAP